MPTSEGVRLDMTIEGMGAYIAGLRSRDVIIELGEMAMRSYSDFLLALTGKRAGDTIEVVYHRGAERHTVDPYHFHTHLAQISQNIEAARQDKI